MASWRNPIAGNDDIVCRARLIAARERKGLSRNALGDQIGLHRAYISRVERGIRNPSLEIMIRWAKFLGCSLDLFDNDASKAA